MIKCKGCGERFEFNGYNLFHSPECDQAYEQKKFLEKLPELYEEAGIPKRFIDLNTDRDIINFTDIKNPRGLYIWGNVGTGKTVMACSIAKRLIEVRAHVKFLSSAKFIVELQSAWRKEGESVDEILKNIARTEVLIFDDIGAEGKLTDFVRQVFYYLINEREQWCLKTIFTSNFSLDRLDGYIDSRISSRIAGMCDIIEIKSKDRRLIKTVADKKGL